ncbi:hypothetical protein [Massilia sp. NR 4-1]|uniref:hypothetical protein n=1 Tax=Massilia sp. NR 4-1 TaxID=1678028 RepID=UPI00067C64E1|nr:hypothetical protein [Massilia sp. NR 4-1]AKU23442.1 hypothetical protein ACZ75_20250 [Massilia sp. NR 4-1]
MSNYTKVQFLSWELYTGPAIAPSGGTGKLYKGIDDNTDDKRTDALGQCRDIDARLAFTADAIAKAEAASDHDKNTLKVFMAPEFLYRGTGGAYLHDLLNGWDGAAHPELGLSAPYNGAWPGLFGKLRALVADAKYEHWVFVFGTVLSASFPAAKASNGRYLLDPTQTAECYNCALIQRGGPTHGAVNYIGRKQYKSHIDFIRLFNGATAHTDATIRPLDPRSVIPADVLGVPEGGASFRLADINDGAGKPIDFGIEICLDHAQSGGTPPKQQGRLRTAGQLVRIQLVPSGGMSLIDNSICLQPGSGSALTSYVFNCDGLNRFSGGNGSHTEVRSGARSGDTLRQATVVKASSGEASTGAQLPSVVAQVNTAQGVVTGAQLWSNGGSAQGAGQVRVLPSQPL